MRLLLATRSADKAREIREILRFGASGLRGYGASGALEIVSLEEAGIVSSDEEEAVEAFDTFLENAHAKAAFFMARSGMPTLADDSGISVDALGGAPGVKSRRFAAETGLDGRALDLANNEKLLRLLADTPRAQRTAHYTCAAALHLPDGRRFSGLGTCSGVILEQPRGSGGFGYDPLFFDPAIGRTFAELTPDEKHARSHRARAFRALASVLGST